MVPVVLEGEGVRLRPSARGDFAFLRSFFDDPAVYETWGGKRPSDEEIREHLSGNYCRCTGYEAIVDAIASVAEARASAKTEGLLP